MDGRATSSSRLRGLAAAGGPSEVKPPTAAASCDLSCCGSVRPSRPKHISLCRKCNGTPSVHSVHLNSSVSLSTSSFPSASTSFSPSFNSSSSRHPSPSPSGDVPSASSRSSPLSESLFPFSVPPSASADDDATAAVLEVLHTLPQRRFSSTSFRQASARLLSAAARRPYSYVVEGGSVATTAQQHSCIRGNSLRVRSPPHGQRDAATTSRPSSQQQTFSLPLECGNSVAVAPLCSSELPWLTWRLLLAVTAALSRRRSAVSRLSTSCWRRESRGSHCCCCGADSEGSWGCAELQSFEEDTCCCCHAGAGPVHSEKKPTCGELWQLLLCRDVSSLPQCGAGGADCSGSVAAPRKPEEMEGRLGGKERAEEMTATRRREDELAPAEGRSTGETSPVPESAGGAVSHETETPIHAAETAERRVERAAPTFAALSATGAAAAANTNTEDCGGVKTTAGTTAPEAGSTTEQAVATTTPAGTCGRQGQGDPVRETVTASPPAVSGPLSAAVDGVGAPQWSVAQPLSAADATEVEKNAVSETYSGRVSGGSSSSNSSSGSGNSNPSGNSSRSSKGFKEGDNSCRGGKEDVGEKHCSRCIDVSCENCFRHVNDSTDFGRSSHSCCDLHLLSACRAFNTSFCLHFSVATSSALKACPPPCLDGDGEEPASAVSSLSERDSPSPALRSAASGSPPRCYSTCGVPPTTVSGARCRATATASRAAAVHSVSRRTQDFLLPLLLRSPHILRAAPTAASSVSSVSFPARDASASCLRPSSSTADAAAPVGNTGSAHHTVAGAKLLSVLPAALRCFALLLRNYPATAVFLTPSLLQLLRAASAALLASSASLFAQQTSPPSTVSGGVITPQTGAVTHVVSQTRLFSSNDFHTLATGTETAEAQCGEPTAAAAPAGAAAPYPPAAAPVAAAGPVVGAPASGAATKATTGAAELLSATETLLRELLPLSLDLIFFVACAALSASGLREAEKRCSRVFSHVANCAAARPPQASAGSSSAAQDACCLALSPRAATGAAGSLFPRTPTYPSSLAAADAVCDICGCCCFCNTTAVAPAAVAPSAATPSAAPPPLSHPSVCATPGPSSIAVSLSVANSEKPDTPQHIAPACRCQVLLSDVAALMLPAARRCNRHVSSLLPVALLSASCSAGAARCLSVVTTNITKRLRASRLLLPCLPATQSPAARLAAVAHAVCLPVTHRAAAPPTCCCSEDVLLPFGRLLQRLSSFSAASGWAAAAAASSLLRAYAAPCLSPAQRVVANAAAFHGVAAYSFSPQREAQCGDAAGDRDGEKVREVPGCRDEDCDVIECASQVLQLLLLLYSCCVQAVLLLLFFLKPSPDARSLDCPWLDAQAAAAAQWGSSGNPSGSSISSTRSNAEASHPAQALPLRQEMRDSARCVLEAFHFSVCSARHLRLHHTQHTPTEQQPQRQQQERQRQPQQDDQPPQDEQQQKGKEFKEEAAFLQQLQQHEEATSDNASLSHGPAQERKGDAEREDVVELWEQQHWLQFSTSRLLQLDDLLLAAATATQKDNIQMRTGSTSTIYTDSSSVDTCRGCCCCHGRGEKRSRDCNVGKSGMCRGSHTNVLPEPGLCVRQEDLPQSPFVSINAAGTDRVPAQQQQHAPAGARKKFAGDLPLRQQQQLEPRKQQEESGLAQRLQAVTADARKQLLHAMGGALLLLGRGERDYLEKQPATLNAVWRLLLQLLLPRAKSASTAVVDLPVSRPQQQSPLQQQQQLWQERQKQQQQPLGQQQEYDQQLQNQQDQLQLRQHQLPSVLRSASANEKQPDASAPGGLAVEWLLAALLQLAAFHLASLLCNARAAATAEGNDAAGAAAAAAAAANGTAAAAGEGTAAARNSRAAAVVTAAGDAKVARAGPAAAKQKLLSWQRAVSGSCPAAKEKTGRWSSVVKQQLQRLVLVLPAATRTASLFQFYAAKVARLLQRLPSPLGLWSEGNLPLRRRCCCCYLSRGYSRVRKQQPHLPLHLLKTQQEEQEQLRMAVLHLQNQQHKMTQHDLRPDAEASTCPSAVAAAASATTAVSPCASVRAAAAALPSGVCAGGGAGAAAAAPGANAPTGAQPETEALDRWLCSIFLYQQHGHATAAAARDAARAAAAAGAEDLLLLWRELELLFIWLRTKRKVADVTLPQQKKQPQQHGHRQQQAKRQEYHRPVDARLSTQQQLLPQQQGQHPQHSTFTGLCKQWQQFAQQQPREQRRQAEQLLLQQQQEVERQVQQVCMRARGLVVLLAGRSSSCDLAVIQSIVERRQATAAKPLLNVPAAVRAAGPAYPAGEARGYCCRCCGSGSGAVSASLDVLPAAGSQPVSEWLFLSTVLCSLPDFLTSAAAATKDRKHHSRNSAADAAAAAADHQRPHTSWATATAALPGSGGYVGARSLTEHARVPHTSAVVTAPTAAAHPGDARGCKLFPLAGSASDGARAPIAAASEAAAAPAAALWRPTPYAAAKAATRAAVALQQWLCRYPLSGVCGSLLQVQHEEEEQQQPHEQNSLKKQQQQQPQERLEKRGPLAGQDLPQSGLLFWQTQQQLNFQQQRKNCCWPHRFVARWVVHAVADLKARLSEQQAATNRKSSNSSSSTDGSSNGTRESESISTESSEAKMRQLCVRQRVLLLQRFFYWSSSCHPPLHTLALHTWRLLMSDSCCNSDACSVVVGSGSSTSITNSSSSNTCGDACSSSVSGEERQAKDEFLRAARVDLLSCLLTLATQGSTSCNRGSRGLSIRPQQPQQAAAELCSSQEGQKQVQWAERQQQEQQRQRLSHSGTCNQQPRLRHMPAPQQQLPLQHHSLQCQQQVEEHSRRVQQQQRVVACGNAETADENSGYGKRNYYARDIYDSIDKNTVASSGGDISALQQLLVLPSVEQQQLLQCVYVALEAAPQWLQQHVLEQHVLPFCEGVLQQLQQLSSSEWRVTAAAADGVAHSPATSVATVCSSSLAAASVCAAAASAAAAVESRGCTLRPLVATGASAGFSAAAAPLVAVSPTLPESFNTPAGASPLQLRTASSIPRAGGATVLLLVELLQHLPSSMFLASGKWAGCCTDAKRQVLSTGRCTAAAAACDPSANGRSSATDRLQQEGHAAAATGGLPPAGDNSNRTEVCARADETFGDLLCRGGNSCSSRSITAARLSGSSSSTVEGRREHSRESRVPRLRKSSASDSDSSTAACSDAGNNVQVANRCSSSRRGRSNGGSGSRSISRTRLKGSKFLGAPLAQRTVMSQRLEICTYALLEELLQVAFACASRLSAASAAAGTEAVSSAAAPGDRQLQQRTCVRAYLDKELIILEAICRVCCCCWDAPAPVAAAISRHAPELCCYLRQYLCSPKVAAVADYLDAAAAAGALTAAAAARPPAVAPGDFKPPSATTLLPSAPATTAAARRSNRDEAAGCGLLYAAALAVCCCTCCSTPPTSAHENRGSDHQQRSDREQVDVLVNVLLQTLHHVLGARPHFITWAVSKALCFLDAAAATAATRQAAARAEAASPAGAAAVCPSAVEGRAQSSVVAPKLSSAAEGLSGDAAFNLMRRVCCATKEALLQLETELPPSAAQTLWHCVAAVHAHLHHWNGTTTSSSAFDNISNARCNRTAGSTSPTARSCVTGPGDAAQDDPSCRMAAQQHLVEPQIQTRIALPTVACRRPSLKTRLALPSSAAPTAFLGDAPAALGGARFSVEAVAGLEPLAGRGNAGAVCGIADGAAVRWCEAALQRGMLAASSCGVLSGHNRSNHSVWRSTASADDGACTADTQELPALHSSLSTAGETLKKLLRTAAVVEPASTAAAVEIRDCVATLFSELTLPLTGLAASGEAD